MATPHSSLTATREAPDHSEQYATFAIRSKIKRGTREKERGGEGKEKEEKEKRRMKREVRGGRTRMERGGGWREDGDRREGERREEG